jgi:hypothetical protein
MVLTDTTRPTFQKRVGKTQITKTDVLSGRGGWLNSHPGNIRFREFVSKRKHEYSLAARAEKTQICLEVVAQVYAQSPPGRFLRPCSNVSQTFWWEELDDDRIMAKTTQALREGAPEIREKLYIGGNKRLPHERWPPKKREATPQKSVPLHLNRLFSMKVKRLAALRKNIEGNRHTRN